MQSFNVLTSLVLELAGVKMSFTLLLYTHLLKGDPHAV